MHGQLVCATHGGQSPQAKNSAMARMIAAADPVAGELIRIALRGESEAVRVSAIRDILDRTGYAAKQMLELSGSTGVVIQYLTDDSVQATSSSPPDTQ